MKRIAMPIGFYDFVEFVHDFLAQLDLENKEDLDKLDALSLTFSLGLRSLSEKEQRPDAVACLEKARWALADVSKHRLGQKTNTVN